MPTQSEIHGKGRLTLTHKGGKVTRSYNKRKRITNSQRSMIGGGNTRLRRTSDYLDENA